MPKKQIKIQGYLYLNRFGYLYFVAKSCWTKREAANYSTFISSFVTVCEEGAIINQLFEERASTGKRIPVTVTIREGAK